MRLERTSNWLRYALAVCLHYSGIDMVYRRVCGAGLVVLMLHRVRDEHDPFPLSLTKASLCQMVEWLRRRQALVGLDEGLQALSASARSQVNYAITFDDGYHDNLRLIDAELGTVPAVIYIVTDHIGGAPIWVYQITHAVESRTCHRLDLGDVGLGHFDLSDERERERLYALLPPRLKQLEPQALNECIASLIDQIKPNMLPGERREMLDWSDVRHLHKFGVRIGAHTRNHVLLSRVDEGTAHFEITGSHDRIAAEIDAAPRHFAYPNGGAGDFTERDVRLAQAAGFTTAATSIEGINRRGVDPYRLLRHNVHESRFRAPTGHLSPALFFSETSGLLGWLRMRRTA